MENKFKESNNQKLYLENHIISSQYFYDKVIKKILVVSDIHYHPNVDKEILKLLVEYCRKSVPDIIVMPGDQIETIDFIDDINEKCFFEKMILDMSEIAPVIMIPGNHEIGYFGKQKFFEKINSEGRRENSKAIKYFESLNRFNNVYFLNNEQISIKGMNFLGFNPRLETYLKIKDLKINEIFIEDYIKSGLKMMKEDYNILLYIHQ